MKAEVLCQGDDGEGRALVKGLLEGTGHLAGTPPPEPFIVLDITARLLATWRYCDKLIWLTQADGSEHSEIAIGYITLFCLFYNLKVDKKN